MSINISTTRAPLECPIVETDNIFIYITILAGTLGLASCLAVLVVIFAFRKDVYFVRERIIVGLVTACALYSILSITPVWLRHPAPSCLSYLPSEHLHYLRMSWFAFKFAIVCYEIFIISFSIYALRLQSSIKTVPKWIEAIGHILCWLASLFILIYSCIHARPYIIEITDYSNGQPLSPDCDYECIHAKYQLFISLLNIASDGLFVFAIILWLIMRLCILRPLRLNWKNSYAIAEKQWSRDYWDESDKPQLELKQKLMVVQQRNFEDVGKPLERYVWVFIMFSPPAVVLALPYCAEHTNLFQTCQAPTEMVLGFRSFMICVVYFMDSECRSQLYNWRKLRYKLAQRMCGSGGGRSRSVVTWAEHQDQIKIIDSNDYNDDDDDDTDNNNPNNGPNNGGPKNGGPDDETSTETQLTIIPTKPENNDDSVNDYDNSEVYGVHVDYRASQVGATQQYHLMGDS